MTCALGKRCSIRLSYEGVVLAVRNDSANALIFDVSDRPVNRSSQHGHSLFRESSSVVDPTQVA